MGFIIILRDKQLILQTGTGFRILIGEQLELGGNFGNHGLELGIAGFVCTAAVSTTHTALSTTGTAIAAASARAFSKSSANSTEKRNGKNHRDDLFHKEYPPSLISISGLTLSLLDIMYSFYTRNLKIT